MIWSSAGTVSAATVSHPWRTAAAPGTVATLSDYVMQPPDGVPEGDDEGEDSTNVERGFPEPPGAPAAGDSVPQQRVQPPAWMSPDTTARSDSLMRLPGAQPAQVETIGPPSGSLPFPASGSGAAKPAVKPRRGILGVHPAALLVGMIALHVFVVGRVTK